MLIAFLTAVMLAITTQAAPGPNLLAVASVAISQGRGQAIMVAAGVATGVWVWIFACAFGVSALFDYYPVSGDILRVVGGVYFVFISIRTIVAIRKGTQGTISKAKAPLSLGAAYRRGLLVVMTNPKAAFMWISITAFLFGSGLNSAEVFWLAPVGSMTALMIYSGYGCLFSTTAARAIYKRMASGLEWTFGLMFGLLGLQLIYEGLLALIKPLQQGGTVST